MSYFSLVFRMTVQRYGKAEGALSGFDEVGREWSGNVEKYRCFI